MQRNRFAATLALSGILICNAAFADSPRAAAAAATASQQTTVITDIAKWNHPVKAVFAKYKLTLQKVKLIDKTYPVFYVKYPSPSDLQEQGKFEDMLRAVARANGYWPFQVTDGVRSSKVASDPHARTVSSISHSGMSAYFKSPAPIPVSYAQAGLHPLPVTTPPGELNARISKLLANPGSYTDADYKLGLVREGIDPLILADDAYRSPLLGAIGIGDTEQAVRLALGKPSYADTRTLIYRTAAYYAGFRIADGRVSLAAFAPVVKQKSPYALRDTILALDADPDLQRAVDRGGKLAGIFEENGHIHGGGWYATTLSGMNVESFEEDTIEVYSNYTGSLFKTPAGFKYQVVFTDADLTAERISGRLDAYAGTNGRFASEGLRSPAGTYSLIYDYVTSDSRYFTVRTLDRSKPDRYYGAAADDGYQWLSDGYILYKDMFSGVPYLIAIAGEEQIDLLDAAGIAYPRDDWFGDASLTVADRSTIVFKADGKTYKIAYSFDRNGKIQLKKA